MTTKAIRVWYAMTVTFVVTIAFAATSVIYTNKVARENQRQWCGVVTTMDDAYRQTPPQTPAGRKIATDIAQLRVEFGCD